MVSFRPTVTQALARGGCLGGFAGFGGCLVVLCLVILGVPNGMGAPRWLVIVAAPVVVGIAVGAVSGLAFGREEGADIDNLGIHPVPPADAGYAPWQRIQDIRSERRGGRTHVSVYYGSGQVERLRAPYDGRLLAGDREFERKLFMLRNLWETHRSFTINRGQHPSDSI